MPQCTDKERLMPTALDTRSAGEHGRSCTLLDDGFQEWILAGLMALESQQCTTFMVGNLGFYEFTRMPLDSVTCLQPSSA